MPSSWSVPPIASVPAVLYIEEVTIDLTQTVTDKSLVSLLSNITLITAITVKQMDSLCTFKMGSTSASVITMKDVGEWRPNLCAWDIFITKLAAVGNLVLEVHGR